MFYHDLILNSVTMKCLVLSSLTIANILTYKSCPFNLWYLNIIIIKKTLCRKNQRTWSWNYLKTVFVGFLFFLNNSAVVKLFVLLTTIILWRLHYSYEKHLGSIENEVNDDSGVGGNGWVERTGPLACLSLFSVNCWIRYLTPIWYLKLPFWIPGFSK